MKTLKQKKNMEQVKKSYFAQERAKIESLRKKAEFGRARAVIAELKRIGAPLFWDLLFDALKTGRLQERYAKRFAEQRFDDWADQQVRNSLLKKFNVLADPYWKYIFPQEFVTVAEDGSFDLNPEAVDEYYQKRYTYEFTDDQVKAIEEICNGLDKLKVTPAEVVKYFASGEGKMQPYYAPLGEWLRSQDK